MLESFLRDKQFPGKILFAKVWGSRSHNCEVHDSDWDYSGVYAAPLRVLLGLNPPKETCDGQNPDYSFHEAGKFCRLLLRGNPGILEMLWTDRMTYESDEWNSLKQHRRKFLSQQAVDQYVGFAESQIKLIKRQGFREKSAYHLVRLLQDAKRIAAGGEPVVWKEGEEREELMEIRSGKCDLTYIDMLAAQLLNEISENVKDLPAHGDEQFLEDWLINLRYDSK